MQTLSNYGNNYNALQLVFPLEIGLKINLDDELVSFLKAIEGVNLRKYLKRRSSRGRKGFDKVMLLKIILFARMIGVSDTRGIASLCAHDIRFLYLSNEKCPSHMAFERLFTDYLIKDIDDIFFDISQNIVKLMNVDTSIQYIDGTKFEANANKYSFVYKTRIVNARKKLCIKITDTILLLNQSTGFNFLYEDSYCAQEIGYIAQYLMEVMVQNNITPVYGKGKRKHHIQRFYDEFLEYYLKLEEYEYWLHIIGERNSCSKIDHDATMCATKIDYYCNTGLSRPCYNAQIAVSNGIIVNSNLYQRPGDSKNFIPLMERYKEFTGEYPKYPMADAGYGSFDNYMYCLTNQMELVMKYTMYAKKNEAKFKKKKFDVLNWETNEEGYKVCPNGQVFSEYKYDEIDEKGKYLRIKQKLSSKEGCAGCENLGECCKSKNQNRIISRDVVLNEFYGEVDRNLSTGFGKELKKQRSIQVEGAFGVIKQNMKFTRFTRRGLDNAKMEFLIVCLGYNFIKYHNYRIKQKLH